MGPVRANRTMRQGMRGLVRRFTDIGIKPSRIALELQFQSVIGQGGREGLKPREAWFRVVKWEALAARQVAQETKIDSVWSWGWATFSKAGEDADKRAAVCVYVWARDPTLCDGPKHGGPAFVTSRTEGQLILPRGARCTFDGEDRSGARRPRGSPRSPAMSTSRRARSSSGSRSAGRCRATRWTCSPPSGES